MGVDRSGGQYRSCGTEIHKMGVDRCTNMYKCTKMGVDRCGGEGQCGDQVGAPGAREKDTGREGQLRGEVLVRGTIYFSIDPKFSLKKISN